MKVQQSFFTYLRGHYSQPDSSYLFHCHLDGFLVASGSKFLFKLGKKIQIHKNKLTFMGSVASKMALLTFRTQAKMPLNANLDCMRLSKIKMMF